MSLPIKTKEEIFDDMVAYAVSQGTPITDFGPGSIMGEFFRATAWKISEYYMDTRIEWENTLAEFIYTSFQFLRKQGSKATGIVVFSSATPVPFDVAIPIGTIVETDDGIQYQTTTAGTILTGFSASGNVTVEAMLTGVAGNVFASKVVNMVTTIGLVVASNNSNPTTGGTDQESDQELADRFAIFVSNLVRSNIQGLISGALSVAGVKNAYIVEDLGEFATGFAVFTANPVFASPVVIPKGTRIKTASEIYFETVSDVTIPAMTADSPVVVIRARDRGLNGNVLANAINLIVDPVTHVTSVNNSLGTAGGTAGQLGRITLYVDDGSGTIPAPVMTQVRLVIEGNGTTTYPGYRPAGIVINYKTPFILPISYSQTIYYQDGANVTDLKNKIESAQTDYINTSRMGVDIVLSQLIKIAKSNIEVLDVKINLPLNNFLVGKEQVGKVSTISTTMSVFVDQ